MPNARLALYQYKMTLEVESSPILGCPVFPRRRSSGESSGTNSSLEEHVRIIPPQLYSPRSTGFPCTILTPGITVSASSPTPSPSPINGDCPAQVHHSNANMVLQRSPSSHGGRSSSIRRNTSGTRLGPTSPSMATRSGVSRSQSLRTSRSRPQSLEPGNRFRNRIASIPCDMTIPGNNNGDGHTSRASSNHSLPLPADENDYTRLRNFSVTSKGLVNRGDSFRSKSRSSHSVASNNSVQRRGSTEQETVPVVHAHRGSTSSIGVADHREGANVSPLPTVPATATVSNAPTAQEMIQVQPPKPEHKSYRVLLLGSQEVGKSALTRQFTTSEYICAYDSSQEEENEKTVEVVLNGEESEMVFVEYPHVEDMHALLSAYKPDAYVVVYSVTSKRSFQQAKDILHLIQRVQEEPGNAVRAVILVGNKTDLVRLRAVNTEDGRAVASSHDCKFIETSVGINHHVDELLVGTLAQIRLKHKLNEKRRASSFKESISQAKGKTVNRHNTSSSSSYSCSGCKAKGLIKRILKKACSKSKSCDNLHVL